MTLLSDVNRPGSQEDMVIKWDPARSLVEYAISGAEITATPCLLALAVARLPLCLWQGEGLICSRLALLCYSLHPLLCERAGLCLRAFPGKVLSLSLFSLWLFPQFGLLSHISSLRLSSGHSGPVLTLCMQPAPPCSAPAHCWQMRVSSLPLCLES